VREKLMRALEEAACQLEGALKATAEEAGKRLVDAPVRELWWHQHGCRRWLQVRRDPYSQAILECQALEVAQ
jgi:hypothetical protein